MDFVSNPFFDSFVILVCYQLLKHIWNRFLIVFWNRVAGAYFRLNFVAAVTEYDEGIYSARERQAGRVHRGLDTITPTCLSTLSIVRSTTNPLWIVVAYHPFCQKAGFRRIVRDFFMSHSLGRWGIRVGTNRVVPSDALAVSFLQNRRETNCRDSICIALNRSEVKQAFLVHRIE